jgi:acyl-CoA synthetase (AMP-forming)/AMP-acid ligase II
VIGVPDERWGETPMAFVVLRAGATVTGGQLLRTLRPVLAEYKLPRKVNLISTLPRNASGKILKRVMREPYWQDLKRRVN